MYALFRLAITTGMRQGELLGLRWEDIADRRIRIRQALHRTQDGHLYLGEPEGSTRTISIGVGDHRILDEHRRKQAEEKLQYAGSWAHPELVFVTRIGTWIRPRNLLRQFKQLARSTIYDTLLRQLC